MQAGTNAADCPRADQIHTEIKANPAYLQIQQENQKIFDYISNKTGGNILAYICTHNVVMGAHRQYQSG